MFSTFSDSLIRYSNPSPFLRSNPKVLFAHFSRFPKESLCILGEVSSLLLLGLRVRQRSHRFGQFSLKFLPSDSSLFDNDYFVHSFRKFLAKIFCKGRKARIACAHHENRITFFGKLHHRFAAFISVSVKIRFDIFCGQIIH